MSKGLGIHAALIQEMNDNCYVFPVQRGNDIEGPFFLTQEPPPCLSRVYAGIVRSWYSAIDTARNRYEQKGTIMNDKHRVITGPTPCRVMYLSETPPGEQMLSDYPDLLTVQDLHEITGVSEQVIRAEVRAGHLPGQRIGRRIFVAKPVLIQYMMGSLKGE